MKRWHAMAWHARFGAMALAFYLLLLLGGILSYALIGGPPSGSEWTAPLFLFLLAALMLGYAPHGSRLPLALGGLWGLLAEFVGVKTGFPFGSYTYTEVLYPKLFGVPIAIGCAWVILFAYVKQLLRPLRARGVKGRITYAACGAAMMVAVDLLIDPLAAGPLDYWRWPQGGWYLGIPASNFAGWFVVSLPFFLLYPVRVARSTVTLWLGLSLLVFFTGIAFARGPQPAAWVGLALIGAHCWLARRALRV